MQKIPISAKDRELDQETLYILHNPSLMKQIQRSLETHRQGKGYVPLPHELETLTEGEKD